MYLPVFTLLPLFASRLLLVDGKIDSQSTELSETSGGRSGRTLGLLFRLLAGEYVRTLVTLDIFDEDDDDDDESDPPRAGSQQSSDQVTCCVYTFEEHYHGTAPQLTSILHNGQATHYHPPQLKPDTTLNLIQDQQLPQVQANLHFKRDLPKNSGNAKKASSVAKKNRKGRIRMRRSAQTSSGDAPTIFPPNPSWTYIPPFPTQPNPPPVPDFVTPSTQPPPSVPPITFPFPNFTVTGYPNLKPLKPWESEPQSSIKLRCCAGDMQEKRRKRMTIPGTVKRRI